MTSSAPVELRNDANVYEFDVLDGGSRIACARTETFVLLTDISWKNLQELIMGVSEILCLSRWRNVSR